MKKSKLVRSTSMIMAVMMVALTFFSTFVMPAGAATSLPYIEEIKESKQNGGSAFKIVEIAPTADTGNMGYYVDGQEPSSIAGWSTRIASIQNASERSAYVNGILTKLQSTGLMSDTQDAAPLYLAGTYAEHYAWDSDASTYIGDSATTPATKLTLDQTETFIVAGEIIEMPNETGGDYQLTYNYNLASGGNLFNYAKWRNTNSTILNSNSTSGDTVTFDDANKSFTIKTDSVGGGSAGTSQDVFLDDNMGTKNFVVRVDPNSMYTFSYDVTTSGGNAQTFVFVADSSRQYWNSKYVLSSSNGIYYGEYKTTGHYEYTFMTGTAAKYLSFRFGTTAANMTATYSDISLYKLGTDNSFSYKAWNDTSSRNINDSSNGTVSYDTTNGSVTLTSSSSSSNLYTAGETANGFYSVAVEPNTTYNISYVTTGDGYSSLFAFVTDESRNCWTTSGDLIKSQTGNCTRTYNTYREFQYTKGAHTVSITTGADAKYLALRMGTAATSQTVTFGNIWVYKAQSALDSSVWLKTVTTSDSVSTDLTAKTVTLSSKALAVTTNSKFSATTFDKDTTYTVRFKVTLDPSMNTSLWHLGHAAINVNGVTNTYKEFTSDGYYDISVDTAEWMNTLSLDFYIDSPNTTFTISDISILSSAPSGTAEEDTPEYVQSIDYFVYGEAETELGDNLFSFSKWSTNTNSFRLCSNTSGDTLTADFENSSVKVTDDGTGSTDMYTSYGSSADYYFMNVEPNKTYRLSFDVKADAGEAQFYIFPCASQVVMDTSNNGATVTPEGGTATWADGFRHIGTGTYTQTFTTNKDTLYLQIRLGVDAAGSKVTFSDIVLQEVKNPVNYYYSVTPTEYGYYVRDAGGNIIYPDDGTVLYTKNDDGHYEYYGVYKSDNSGVKIYTNGHYYSLEISDDCWPSDDFNESQPYRAVSSLFRKQKTYYDDEGNVTGKEKGYFTREYGTLTYIGNKEGNADVDITGTDQLTIQTNIVYYTGGYINNNWFRRRVLDIDDTDTKEVTNEDGTKSTVPKYDFPITVTTVTPDDENLENTLRGADLIVITDGIDVLGTGDAHYKTTTIQPDNTTTTTVKDIPDDTIDSIISTVGSYVTDKGAIIIDTDVYSSSDIPANLLKLCQSVTTETTGKVNGSIYTFSASQLGVSDLANANFLKEFAADSYNQSSKPYYPVWYELDQEDTYRGLKSLTPLTEEQDDVNEAAVIRYILNYKKQRLYQSLNALKVLDIEPISTVPTITIEMINSMMPSDNQYDEDHVNIVTMSVAEFVGKNENFDEEYDLVYIGSSTENYNTIESGTTDSPFTFSYRYKTGIDESGNDTYDTATATVTNGVFDDTYKNCVANGLTRNLKVGSPIYNDETLNGYYYSNVGDTITTTTSSTLSVDEGISYPDLSGLLAEDYVNIGDALDEVIASAKATASSGNLWDKISGSVQSAAYSYAIDAVNFVTGDAYAHYWVKGGHATFRTTGADLNQTALDRLQSYIDAGRPVIISDDLTTEETSVTLKAVADVKMTKVSTKTYKFDFSCSLQGDVPSNAIVSYQWFRNNGTTVSAETGVQGNGSFSKTVSSGAVTYDSEGNYNYVFNGFGTYYCEVTISYNGNYSLKSNNCYVSSGQDQYKLYLRATDTGDDKAWIWPYYREKYNYYIDTPDNLPDGWTYTLYWEYKNAVGNWDDGSYDMTYTSHANQNRVLITFYYTDEDGNKQDLVTKVKKVNGSATEKLYGWLDGDMYSSSDIKKGNAEHTEIATQYYEWRDLSTAANHKRVDNTKYYSATSYNGKTDYTDTCSLNTPSNGFDVPFIYTLGTVKTSVEAKYNTVTISSPSEINTDAIDNCSYMYQFLINNYYRDKSTKNGADNMFNVKDAKADTNMLANCFKISKPEIEFRTQPAEYPSQLSGRSLDFTFYIRDNSNPKDDVTYTSWAYIDLNGDGKFSEYEKQLGKKVTNNPISKGKENNLCTLSVPVSNMSGLISWKIEVKENVDTDSSYQGSASYEGFSYIKPSTDDPIKINAIMILPGAWNDTYKSLSEMIANKDSITVDGKSYVFKNNVSDYWGADEYIGNVFESEVFDSLDNLKRLTNEELGVGSDGIDNHGLYHMGFNVNNGDILIDIAVTNIHDMNTKFTADPDSDFFTKSGYSMMIMGFGDNWGKTTATWNDDLLGIIDNTIPEGFEIETATAVCDYIDQGFQTIFCHDTLNKNVNFVNLYWDKVKGVGTKKMSAMMTGVNWIIENIINPIITAVGSDKTVSYYNVSDDEYKDSRVKNGYWNNLIMRDTLGLDRYGITYAIKVRAAAINEGIDTDSHNTKYKGEGMYSNAILGRAHMYEYIYDYDYAKETVKNTYVDRNDDGTAKVDASGEIQYTSKTITRDTLSLESMLEKNYSVAYVPGTAVTYERAPDASDMTIKVQDRAIKSGETLVKTYGADSNNPIKLVAKATTSTYNQYINDTGNLPDIYRANGTKVSSDSYTVSDNKLYYTKKVLGITYKNGQIDDLQLDGTLVVNGSNQAVTATTTKYTDYAYLGKVYNKGTEQIIDEYDDTYTTIHYGKEADYEIVDGVKTYTVYAGMPIVDTDGNIIADWDEYTQGFTDYVIQRYMDEDESENKLSIRPIWEDNDYGDIIETDKITQVNRGKITTYPYDINNDGMFDISGKTTAQTTAAMNKTYDIATTHEQVYQCNMNGDDITVWYALAGGQYYDSEKNTGVRNDCANAYYIYSRDNLIYTGAGHTNKFTKMEAELFINTLVASYRDKITYPTMSFRNSTDNAISKYVLVLPAVDDDGNVTLEANDYIYFKMTDENTSEKTLYVKAGEGDAEYQGSMYYYDYNGEKQYINANEMPLLVEQKNGDGTIVYETKTVNGKEVSVPKMVSVSGATNTTSTAKLTDTQLYAFAVPDQILQQFKDHSDLVSITLYATPEVAVKNQTHHSKTVTSSSGATAESDNIVYKSGETQKIEIRVLHLADLT